VPSTNFEEVGAVVSNFEIRISNFGAIAMFSTFNSLIFSETLDKYLSF